MLRCLLLFFCVTGKDVCKGGVGVCVDMNQMLERTFPVEKTLFWGGRDFLFFNWAKAFLRVCCFIGYFGTIKTWLREH